MLKNYEKLTDAARVLMSEARKVAERYDNNYIGVEHIVGAIAKTVTKRSIRIELTALTEKFLKKGEKELKGQTILTEACKKVLEYAQAASRELGSELVDVDHIALAILGDKEGIGKILLEDSLLCHLFIEYFFPDEKVILSNFSFIKKQTREKEGKVIFDGIIASVQEAQKATNLENSFWKLMAGAQVEDLVVDNNDVRLRHLMKALIHELFIINSGARLLRAIAMVQLGGDKIINLDAILAIRLSNDLKDVMKTIITKWSGKEEL